MPDLGMQRARRTDGDNQPMPGGALEQRHEALHRSCEVRGDGDAGLRGGHRGCHNGQHRQPQPADQHML